MSRLAGNELELGAPSSESWYTLTTRSGSAYGRRLQQHAVHDGKDGRIRADAQRQHQHRADRESRAPAEVALCVADVPS